MFKCTIQHEKMFAHVFNLASVVFFIPTATAVENRSFITYATRIMSQERHKLKGTYSQYSQQ